MSLFKDPESILEGVIFNFTLILKLDPKKVFSCILKTLVFYPSLILFENISLVLNS